jgi:spermidine/putrescine transport system substrate-binding protein
MRVRIALLITLLLLAVPAAAAQDSEPWTCPDGFQGQTINIFNWTTYIAEDTMDNFAAACGITYTYDNFDSNESLVTRIRQGNPGYDIVVPSDYAVATMIDEELLLPLDLDSIPNIVNLAEDLRAAPYDPENEFSVPYLWGTFGIGYNVNSVSEPVTSWTQFFEHDGPVAWTDDPRVMISIGLVMTGGDPNSSDPAEVEAAKQYLIDHSDNVVVIAADDGQELLAREEVDMAIEYNGDIFQLGVDCECEDFAYVVPDEGTGISSGFLAVPVGAQNPDLAMVFIDYILDPQVSADIANYTTYPTPNQAAIDLGLIDPVLLDNPGIYPPEEARANLFFLLLQDPDTEQLFNDTWDEIKISIQAG